MYINSLGVTVKEFFDVLFLPGIRDFIKSGKIPGLRKVEMNYIYHYVLRLAPVYINRDRKNLGYPPNNFFFGETPYNVAEMICNILEVDKKDVVYDLGCGRGKFLFFVNLYCQARCIGVDLIRTYIDVANKIIQKLRLKDIYFFQEDILSVNLSTASVILIHGSTFSEDTHQALIKKIKNLKAGTRLVVYSVEYEQERLRKIRSERVMLSWGYTDLHFYEIVDGGGEI
ncbi:MAG: methyltransferase domain-containing protein [Vulcanimicrobiota bacterium]